MQDFFFQEGRGLREAVMQHLPPNFSSLLRQSSSSAERDIMPAPALDAHVFVQVLADCGEVELDPSGRAAPARTQRAAWLPGRHVASCSCWGAVKRFTAHWAC